MTFPTHRLHARLDESASGVSFGDEFGTKLSRINGAINRMSEEQMRKKLAEFGLSTRYGDLCIIDVVLIVLYR